MTPDFKPPGSWYIGDGEIMAWQIVDSISVDLDAGDHVRITTPDHLYTVGEIVSTKSDGSYILRLVGVAEPENGLYRLFGSRERPQTCVQKFPEDFRRIISKPMHVEEITGATHALGTFMECVKSLGQ